MLDSEPCGDFLGRTAQDQMIGVRGIGKIVTACLNGDKPEIEGQFAPLRAMEIAELKFIRKDTPRLIAQTLHLLENFRTREANVHVPNPPENATRMMIATTNVHPSGFNMTMFHAVYVHVQKGLLEDYPV